MHAHTHWVNNSFNIYTQISQSENENVRKPIDKFDLCFFFLFSGIKQNGDKVQKQRGFHAGKVKTNSLSDFHACFQRRQIMSTWYMSDDWKH